LKTDGVFAFNTTFFNGAYVDGTGAFWRRWVVRAVQVLRERGIEVKHSDHAVARQFLTPEEYSDLCVLAGFARPSVDLVRIEMTPESMRDIGRFSLFIEGALPGVPLEEGSAALEEGLERAMDGTGVCGVPRNWLEWVARAPEVRPPVPSETGVGRRRRAALLLRPPTAPPVRRCTPGGA